MLQIGVNTNKGARDTALDQVLAYGSNRHLRSSRSSKPQPSSYLATLLRMASSLGSYSHSYVTRMSPSRNESALLADFANPANLPAGMDDSLLRLVAVLTRREIQWTAGNAVITTALIRRYDSRQQSQGACN